MLAHRGRRSAPYLAADEDDEQPDERIPVNGNLLSTGSFIFNFNGNIRALSYPQLGTFSVAGDPRILSGNDSPIGITTLFRSYSNFNNDPNVDAFPFFDGFFDQNINLPQIQNLAGSYPTVGARVFRHYSDNMQAVCTTTDLSWSGSAQSGWTVFMNLNGNEVGFDLEGINPGSGIGGNPGILLDTYWGGAIGLGTGIYIGADRRPNPVGAVGHWWDGVNLTPIGQPPLSFFRNIWGSTNLSNESYNLIRVRPVCRNGFNSALCAGTALTQANGRVSFPDWRNNYWPIFFLGYSVQSSPGSSQRLDVHILSNIPENRGGMPVNPLEAGVELRIPRTMLIGLNYNGTSDFVCNYTFPSGYNNPIITGFSGQINYSGGMFLGNTLIRSTFGFTGEFLLMAKRRNGPYELWLDSDPLRPAYNILGGAPRLTNTNIYESIGYFVFSMNQPINDSVVLNPYPKPGIGSVGERVTAACFHSNLPFVMTLGINQNPGLWNGARIGFIGNTFSSPFGFNQSSPRSANGLIFVGTQISANNGLNWYNVPGFQFGPGNTSCGAETVNWTFRLTPEQLNSSIIIA